MPDGHRPLPAVLRVLAVVPHAGTDDRGLEADVQGRLVKPTGPDGKPLQVDRPYDPSEVARSSAASLVAGAAPESLRVRQQVAVRAVRRFEQVGADWHVPRLSTLVTQSGP